MALVHRTKWFKASGRQPKFRMMTMDSHLQPQGHRAYGNGEAIVSIRDPGRKDLKENDGQPQEQNRINQQGQVGCM